MSVWCGRYREVVYSVPKEVKWYCVCCGRYMEVACCVPKEVEWYECVVGKVQVGGVWRTQGGGVVLCVVWKV